MNQAMGLSRGFPLNSADPSAQPWAPAVGVPPPLRLRPRHTPAHPSPVLVMPLTTLSASLWPLRLRFPLLRQLTPQSAKGSAALGRRRPLQSDLPGTSWMSRTALQTHYLKKKKIIATCVYLPRGTQPGSAIACFPLVVSLPDSGPRAREAVRLSPKGCLTPNTAPGE